MADKIDRAITTTRVLNNKRSRSTILLLLSFIIILAINALVPLIEGQAHYTVEAVDYTYSEFLEASDDNANLRLTWISEIRMKDYVYKYIDEHPELTPEEEMLVEVPDTFKVTVYTKFFYQYPFWYISTLVSLGSALILFYSLFNYLITRNKDTYAKYVNLEKQVTALANDCLDPVTFEPWLDNKFNRQRKIKQHISNVKFKIDKLEKATDFRTKKKFKRYFEELEQVVKVDGAVSPDITDPAETLKNFGKLKRKERRYINKKETYLYYLDTTYIEKYVVNGKVKYFKYINPMFIYNGINYVGRTIDSYSTINTDEQQVSNDAGNKILFSIVNTLIFAVLFTVTAVATYEQSPFWIVINILAKIAPLFIQVPLSINYSNSFMDNQLITNLIHRRTIGLLYLADNGKAIPDEHKKEA